jgi:hypothetical protein
MHMTDSPDSRDSESLIPATPTNAINFALGVLDAMSVIAATLIGRGIVEPTAFQDDLQKYAKLWRSKDLPARAMAAEEFGKRLKIIERTKLATKAHLVLPDAPWIN